MDSNEPKRKKHNLLRMYYGMDHSPDSVTTDPCDINGAHFKPDVYLQKLLKEKSLGELMDKEEEMFRDIRSLDSDMQTLVYENYNKFISATDTIRKMKSDFCRMESEMDQLSKNMASITDFTSKISTRLSERRDDMMQMSKTHSTLKKLQFFFELPKRLEACVSNGQYNQAVNYYLKTQAVMDQYKDLPSFDGIRQECLSIVEDLKDKLKERQYDKDLSARLLVESVDLLLQLGEPAETLCDEFLSHARTKINTDLDELDRQVELCVKSDPTVVDILEFIDMGCNGYLNNICLVISSYSDMFLNRSDDQTVDMMARRQLVIFVHELMQKYFECIQRRVQCEKETGDNTILVRSLDRFHRRLQAMNKLLVDVDFSRSAVDIITQAAQSRISHYLSGLKQHFSDCLTDIRQNLAAPKLVVQNDSTSALQRLLDDTEHSILEQIKSVLLSLQAFIAPDITFAQKPHFQAVFASKYIREGLLVSFFNHIHEVCVRFCDTTVESSSAPAALLLLLAKLCANLETSVIQKVFSSIQEVFLDVSSYNITPLCEQARQVAQMLLNNYVHIQGLLLSQMLRKSVEARDWLNTIEPRNVRAVMKRVVEDVTTIDSQVGQLYEEGTRKESSDSSRPTFGSFNIRGGKGALDNSLIQKLFSEKIDVFTSVEFNKASVLTGIIKIALKTFLECVRLRTFAKYGLQQIQVDCHYMQIYLWRFVTDENLVRFLLDEILASAGHRCIEPHLMEHSVVELICERC